MGQTLSEPITSKHTSVTANNNYRVAASCMQGWRINMEDAHTVLLAMPGDPAASFFAVFDGHGGATIAQHASRNLHKRIVSTNQYGIGNIEMALRHGYLQFDHEMAKDAMFGQDASGTTAVSIIFKNNTIYCANVGDSRAIASVDGCVQQLSFDHKPSNEPESRRIIAAGGWVEFNRVNGNLALSRALGDFSFKKNDRKPAEEQIVTANPDIIKKDLTTSHEFIVLACDGVWDVMSNSEVLQFIRTRIAHREEPSMICEELLNACLAPDAQMGGLGCDNMTVILICLLHGQSYENLASRCTKPAKVSMNASMGSIQQSSPQPPHYPRQSIMSNNVPPQIRAQMPASPPNMQRSPDPRFPATFSVDSRSLNSNQSHPSNRHFR